ncbi:MAG: hypothetical protein AB2A00_11985 [Myxococcota bacterium]
MPRIENANIRALTQTLVRDGKIDTPDANTLLDAALSDKVLSTVERNELKEVLAQHADKFQGEAKDKLNAFLGMQSAALRNMSRELEKNDGIIDAAEAGKLLSQVDKDGKFTRAEKFSLSAVMIGARMSAEAKEIISAKVSGIERPPPGGAPTIDVGLPAVNGSNYRLSPEGHFQVGGNTTPARYDEAGALAAYRAATSLAQAPVDVLKSVPADVKTRMLTHLEKAFKAGAEDQPLPQVARQRMRSAAATTLMAVIEGSTTPEQKGIRDQAIASYLKHAKEEPLADLRASMWRNLDRIKGSLSAEQAKALDELKSSVVPGAPPYEKWFAENGARQVNVVHYAHDDCWKYGDPIRDYQNKGYKLVSTHADENPQRWVLEKANPQAPGGEVKMKIEVFKTHDGLFQEMDNPKTNMILYTGHSNLGGNVSEELRLGGEEKGEKLVLMAMCRGKQNIPEFANKYPNTHFITTDNPSYFSSVGVIATGMTEGALKLQNYDAMANSTGRIWDTGGNQNYFYPQEARRYELYDRDRDGVVDGKGTSMDRLFDVGLKFPAGTKVDLKPHANADHPNDLDGSKVLHAVQFLNTLATYHVDHGHNTSKFGAADMDAFLGGGWFEGPENEAVRLKKEVVDGKTMYRVSVNKAYADQSQFALGTLVQYEVCRQMLAERNGGTLSKDDACRALLFAGEYLSYMYCSYEEAESSIRALARHSGLGNFGFRTVYDAIETDGHGYVTDAQVTALKQKLGIQ